MTCKEYILHQLAEMQNELVLSIDGLNEEQLQTIIPGQKNHIAWIIEHCCCNVDTWLVKPLKGSFSIQHNQRYLSWPRIAPQQNELYRNSNELKESWNQVMQNAFIEIEKLDDLNEKGKYDGKEPITESCLRIINHQNSHIRQIWMIIGYLKLNETKWPKQGKWLILPNKNN